MEISQKAYRGITIIELMVVLVVIGILVSMTTLVVSAQQKQSRDKARESQITLISEALEKYYEQNGEYPSCSQLTLSSAMVTTQTLKGLQPEILKMPKAGKNIDNSITCDNSSTYTKEADQISYIETNGSNGACTTGGSCRSWEMKWHSETDGIKSIRSSRNTPSVENVSNLSGTVYNDSIHCTGQFIVFSWDLPSSYSGDQSVELQISTDPLFSNSETYNRSISDSSVDHYVTGNGISYYGRIRTKSPHANSPWSQSVEVYVDSNYVCYGQYEW